MFMRLIELLLAVLVGSLLVRLVGLHTQASVVGPVAGVVLWVIWDGVRAARVARWLQSRRYNNPPKLLGVWGDFIERSRKSFKRLQRKTQDSQRRLDEFVLTLNVMCVNTFATWFATPVLPTICSSVNLINLY